MLEKAWISTQDKLGTLKPFKCPDCNSVLSEIRDGAPTHDRCHTGHAFTSDVPENLQEQAIEKASYETLRAQRGRGHTLRETASRTLDERERSRLEQRAESDDEDSTTLESLLSARDQVAAHDLRCAVTCQSVADGMWILLLQLTVTVWNAIGLPR